MSILVIITLALIGILSVNVAVTLLRAIKIGRISSRTNELYGTKRLDT